MQTINEIDLLVRVRVEIWRNTLGLRLRHCCCCSSLGIMLLYLSLGMLFLMSSEWLFSSFAHINC